jgi:hypothetical protein
MFIVKIMNKLSNALHCTYKPRLALLRLISYFFVRNIITIMTAVLFTIENNTYLAINQSILKGKIPNLSMM